MFVCIESEGAALTFATENITILEQAFVNAKNGYIYITVYIITASLMDTVQLVSLFETC